MEHPRIRQGNLNLTESGGTGVQEAKTSVASHNKVTWCGDPYRKTLAGEVFTPRRCNIGEVVGMRKEHDVISEDYIRVESLP